MMRAVVVMYNVENMTRVDHVTIAHSNCEEGRGLRGWVNRTKFGRFKADCFWYHHQHHLVEGIYKSVFSASFN